MGMLVALRGHRFILTVNCDSALVADAILEVEFEELAAMGRSKLMAQGNLISNSADIPALC